jgi:hypothetical protein
MPKKSCLLNLLEFPEKVTKNIDKGIHTHIVYLDFANAFDKVPKESLLEKLEGHGFEKDLIR